MQPSTWIVIGSSPTVLQTYPRARSRWGDAGTITCNRGLQVEPDPDFYFLSDQLACQLWAAKGKEASKRGKTKRVTLRRDPQAMKMRSVDDFEIVIREGHPFEPFQMSGLWCVEFAIRILGADQVVMCGLDGYRPGCEKQDYFAGADHYPPNDGLQQHLTAKNVEPLTNRIVAKYPDVTFLCLGAPWYEVAYPNWSVCTSLP